MSNKCSRSRPLQTQSVCDAKAYFSNFRSCDYLNLISHTLIHLRSTSRCIAFVSSSFPRTSKAKSCSYPLQTLVPVQQKGGRQARLRHVTSPQHTLHHHTPTPNSLPQSLHTHAACLTLRTDLGTRLNEEQRRVLMAESERDQALKVDLRCCMCSRLGF